LGDNIIGKMLVMTVIKMLRGEIFVDAIVAGENGCQ
jgi:hypothetical protein